MENLEDLALYQYFTALSADEPIPEGVAVRMKDGNVFHASTLSLWNHEAKSCARLSADEALFEKLKGAYGKAMLDKAAQPVIAERIHARYNADNPGEPHIEFS